MLAISIEKIKVISLEKNLARRRNPIKEQTETEVMPTAAVHRR